MLRARTLLFGGNPLAPATRADRRLWDNGIPDVEQISEFRMENRMALQSCLEVALQFLAAQKVAEGLVTHVRREHITADASRRIVAAIFIDSMEATGPLAAAC